MTRDRKRFRGGDIQFEKALNRITSLQPREGFRNTAASA